MTTSPTVARWELSHRLATRRRELGLTVEDVAKHLTFSRNYWSAVENHRALIAEEKLAQLVDLLQLTDEDHAQLVALRTEARRRGWWEEYPESVLGEETRSLCGLEAGASRVRAYDSHVIPGLLQTEEYARAVIEADPFFSPVHLDEVVEVRMRRQRRLEGEDPLQLSAIVSEASLLQQMAGGAAQIRQLRQLCEVADRRDNVEIRVAPFTVNPGIMVMASTIEFIEFEGRALPTQMWQEAIRALGVVDDDEQRRRLELAWDTVRERSLSPAASRKAIKRAAASLAGD